jgi:hypothetical protein
MISKTKIGLGGMAICSDCDEKIMKLMIGLRIKDK